LVRIQVYVSKKNDDITAEKEREKKKTPKQQRIDKIVALMMNLSNDFQEGDA
tara:strand:+ start:559 stop:714 length:156 start_codon:yes stop_codon:yes gene_type:complete